MNGEARLISAGDLFRQSWRLYRERVGVLTGILIGPIVVGAIGAILAEIGPNGLALIGNLLVFIGLIFYFVAALALLYQLRDDSGVGSSYRVALRNILSYLWLEVVSTFMILGGFLLLVVPGIIFAIWLLFPVYVLVFEGEKRMRAILKSREYIHGHWWQVVRRLAALFLVLVVVIWIPSILILSAVGGDVIISNVTLAIIELILVPFTTIYFYFLYQGLREGAPEITAESLGRSRKLLVFSGGLGLLAVVVLGLALTLGFITGDGSNRYPLPDGSLSQLELPQ